MDVNIYASNSRDASPLVGNHENTDIGDFIREYLDVDTKAVTRRLKEQGTLLLQKGDEWMGSVVEDEMARNRGDHYEGDFKKRGLGEGGCACGGPH